MVSAACAPETPAPTTIILITALQTVVRPLTYAMTHEPKSPADAGNSCENEIDRDRPEYQPQRVSATDRFSQKITAQRDDDDLGDRHRRVYLVERKEFQDSRVQNEGQGIGNRARPEENNPRGRQGFEVGCLFQQHLCERRQEYGDENKQRG